MFVLFSCVRKYCYPEKQPVGSESGHAYFEQTLNTKYVNKTLKKKISIGADWK